MPDAGPTPESVRAALDEVLGWQGLARSPQLAELLRYVVEKTLAGESGAIKAYSIAVDVLGRPTDFDPQSDPIVRVQARRLRSLLEQFYGGGNARTGVEIHLPVGRYVPEFRLVESGEAWPPAARPAEEPERALPNFLSNVMLALTFTLVGVVLAVLVVRWMLPQTIGPGGTLDVPGVTIGTFDNLTGEPVLDDDVAQVAERLAASLARFEMIRVGGGDYRVDGTVQQQNGGFVLRASLKLVPRSDVLWTTTIAAPKGVTDTEALTAAGDMLAAQLGNANGPVHEQGRAWLKLQPEVPEAANSYVCALMYMRWRDNRQLADADAASDCVAGLLADTPDYAIALAASANIASWKALYESEPGDNLVRLLGPATEAVGRAVTLMPSSSFVFQMQAIVLSRQGLGDAALGSISRALDLNPTNMDAVAVSGILLWNSGEYAEGAQRAERALAAITTAPAWYFQVRALNALREERFFDAIDAAQALAQGDDELGPVIALTAAPRAARPDLIDRYRQTVLSNPHFQVAGILPRIEQRVNSAGVMARIRSGLILAGLPASALDGPFGADGKPVGEP